MFKFLRKYNKWILAVGGGLLMIVFLLGDTLPRLTGGAGAAGVTRATVGVNGRERIPAREWSRYNAEADYLRSFELRVGQPILPIGSIEGTEHWYLLVREARAAGLISTPAALGIDDAQLRLIAGTGAPLDVIRSALTNLSGVERLFDLYLNAGEISDHRLRSFASRVFHSVEADVAVIPATAAQIDYEPSASELEAHFQRFRDYAPGEGPMGLGYRLPNRVKIEWLTVTADSVRQAVAASDEVDGVSLRVHWSRNPDGTFPPVEPGQPVPNVVRDDLLKRLTNERLERIAAFISGQVSVSRRGLSQRDGYLVLPEDWSEKRVSFAQLAQEIQERHAVPLPSYQAIGDRWLRLNELNTLPGVGAATTDRFGAPPRRLHDLVRAAKEFGGSATINVQAGVAGPLLRGPDGDIHVFRITEADRARPPHSVDEVRDELRADLRRVAAYERLIEREAEIRRAVEEGGMLAAAIEFDAEVDRANISLADPQMLGFLVQMGRPVELMPTHLPIIGEHRATVEQVIEHAMAFAPDLPVDEWPARDRVLVVPVEDHLSLAVVRINGQRPLSRERYKEVAAMGVPRQLLLAEELGGVDKLRETFSLSTLTQRHNLNVHRAVREEDELADAATLGG